MIFLSFWFVAFALIFFPIYWLVPWPRARLIVIAVACAVFHTHFAGPAGVVPIVVLAVATYLIGLSRDRRACVVGMALCASALIFYKYTHFLSLRLLGSLSTDLGLAVDQGLTAISPVALPLAISFFVFEFVHYLFDVRRGEAPLRNPLHFGLFAIFWPSIVAGPIKRYEQFVPSLLGGVSCVGSMSVMLGLLRVCGGLLKKGMADNLTPWIDYYAPQFETLDLGWRWVFLFFLALRIYLDFSGYSDLAIGYARMMGVTLPENFNWPYLARNIDEFWRRWHISLSSWIRDYVYIPLGGSRAGLARKTLNALAAFALCGLWHGADWSFLLWGLYHGAGLAVCGTYAQASLPGRLMAALFRTVPLAGTIVTFLFVAFGWLLFFYPAPTALKMALLLFGIR